MPAKRKKEQILGTYFVWLLGQRNGVYFADGRTNEPALGRHSLGTRDRAEAIDALQRLDLVMAVNSGRADRSLLDGQKPQSLGLKEGRKLYEAEVGRPAVTGGAKATTLKRYRAVFDKFFTFAASKGIAAWNQVTEDVLKKYASWLDENSYAPRTAYLELTTIKQAVKWFVKAGYLPESRLLKLEVQKPQGTDVHCWRPVEVQAILERCRSVAELQWLGQLLLALVCTGLRISELASLRWTDIRQEKNLILLTDESASARQRQRHRKARETKSGRSRSFPIHDDLRRILGEIPRCDDGLVFHGPRGGVVKPDTVRNILVREVLGPLAERFPAAEGELGFRDGRLHSFRHYFCSVCANSNVPELVVKEWLGHRESQMVRHYYHLHNEEAQRQMKRLRFVDAGGSGADGNATSGGTEAAG